MVRLITLEREYGSGGAEFAGRLAETLGWKLMDQSLVEEVAKQARVPASLAADCDEKLDPWYHRVSRAFWTGSPDHMAAPEVESGLFDSDRMAALQRERVLSAAQEGGCVIVGRGAACILHTYPGAFHVFISAGMKRKTAWFAQHFPDRAQDAEEEIEKADRCRAAYIERHFDQDWGDRRLYHVMLDACMGEEAMLGAVLAGAALRARQPV